MNKPPGTNRGLAVELDDDSVQMLPPVSASARHRVYQRRRASHALDLLLGLDRPAVDLTTITLDYWADCHMHLGLPEREALGRELAMAGWVA